jgi:hypothetical protein
VDGVYCFYPTDSAEILLQKPDRGFVEMFKDEKQFKQNIADLWLLFVPTTPQACERLCHTDMTQHSNCCQQTMSRLVDEKYWTSRDLNSDVVFLQHQLTNPANYKSIMQSLYSDMKYEEWDSVGHFMMMEDPARFNAILEEFLK